MWNTQALGPTLAFLQSSGAGDPNRAHTHIPSLVCQLQHHGLPTASSPGFDMLSADVSCGQTKSVITNLNQTWNVTTSYPDQHRQELVAIANASDKVPMAPKRENDPVFVNITSADNFGTKFSLQTVILAIFEWVEHKS